MKKTNKEWLEIFFKWICRAEALRLIEPSTSVSYSVFGAGTYLSFTFKINGVEFELADDEDANNVACANIEATLQASALASKTVIENKRKELAEQIAMLDAAKDSLNNI